MKITVSTDVNAPIELVWNAYTTPSDIVQWNAASEDWHTTDARVDLRVGGEFSSRMEAKDGSAGFDFAGVFTAIDQHERIAYDFGDRSCVVTFAEHDAVTSVAITFDAETEHPVEMQQAGWQAILDNFSGYVEARA